MAIKAKVRVKVCGITNLDDAQLAIAQGADALGFIFAKSPRRVSIQAATKIIKALPPFINTVGVFVDESVEKIQRIAERTGLNYIQLHGNEDNNTIRQLKPLHCIKAFRVNDDFDFNRVRKSQAVAVLLDTYSANAAGGTGQTFNWAVIPKDLRKDIILAGGLTPNNIAQAIKQIKPYAVDVSSGLEKSPGIKSPGKLKRFFKSLHPAQ